MNKPFSSIVYDADIVSRARALAPALTKAAAAGEVERRLPDGAVDLMHEAELFQIFVPKALGGLELDMVEALEVIEEVSAADGAAGWSLLKGAGSNQLAGYLDPVVVSAIWTGPRAVLAGSMAPKGRAVRDGDGWILSGRWDWGTASSFATWLMSGAFLFEPGSDTPIMGEQGPEFRVFLLPKSQATIHDTWHTHGMRGTGSNDFSVEAVRIPDSFSFGLASLAPRYPGPLYTVPFGAQLMVPHAVVAIGIARAAIAALSDIARGKVPLMSRTLLKDKEWVQDAIGRATAEVEASRAYLYHAVRKAFGGAPFTPDLGLHLSLAATHATHRCVQATERMYRAAGGTAVYQACPIQRQFRDIEVAASHILVNVERYAGAGKVLLGDAVTTLG